MPRNVNLWIVRATGLFLIATASLKVYAVQDLADSIELTTLIPRSAALPLAISLLISEVSIGIALLARHAVLQKAAVIAASLLFSSFVAYNAWRIIMGVGVPCSCFGVILRSSPVVSLLISLCCLCIIAYVGPDFSKRPTKYGDVG